MKRVWRLVLTVVLALCLTGCVDYEVGLTFTDQHHGEIRQHIQLSQQLTRLNRPAARTWLNRIEQRTRQLGGRVKRLSADDLLLTIPFYNGNDLETKFNQFFPQLLQETSPSDDEMASPITPTLQSHLTLTERNFIVVLRDRLTYDLDLRSLGVRSADGGLLIRPTTLLDLRVSLTTPGVATAIATDGSPNPTQEGNQLVWVLKPGEINHLEAIFWVPSPLGVGSLAIIGGVVLGMGVKRLLTPPPPLVD